MARSTNPDGGSVLATGPEAPGRVPQRTVSVALAGPPNVGKSTVFNLLTGLSQHVGNWPGKTIEKKLGTFRRNGETLEIIDLPGTYSLTANSVEEQIARDYIIKEQPRVVVAILSAANLERNLYLIAELLELSTSIVVGLNMMDVARGEGILVEPHVLEAALGVPVVPMVAARNEGLQVLIDTVDRLVDGSLGCAPKRLELGQEVEGVMEEVLHMVGPCIPDNYPPRWLAIKLLEGDREVTGLAREIVPEDRWKKLEALLHRHEDAVIAIASGRYEWIERMTRAAVTRPKVGVVSLTERLDRVATHLYAGPAVLLALMALIFWLVYSLATPAVEFMDTGVGGGAELIRSTLSGAPPWVAGLLADGVLGGVGTVLTLLPILAIFFVVLSILEDVGYMARAAFVADRFMHPMGLHGKSFLPLFLGFGCNVPAVLGSRIIESGRARLLTILLAPFVPCAGRMAVLIFIAAAVFGAAAPFVVWGMVAFSLIVLAVSGIVINALLFRGETPAFIMELPLYHLPNWRTIALTTWRRLVAFVVRAGTVILLASVIIWALATLPGGEIDSSYLAEFGRYLAPLGQLMGLDWRMVVALLTSFVAKENTLAALAVLLAASEEGTLVAALPQILSPAAAVAFLLVQMLFVPCVATVAAVRQETGSWRWTGFSLAYMLGIALTIGILAYQVTRLLGLGV